jgi:CheY-like chemotaxis protein
MRVLVADFDADRSARQAEACSSRGYVVDRVSHGAAALELALERVPDVLLCPIDLPVIDGQRLAEVLRGNPRTRHASFIFLVKDELDAPMAMDPRDGTVVAPWHEEDVLDHIDAFLERSARFGEARSDTEIEGKLTQISLVDLLQIFQMNKRSGTLRIWRSGGSGSGSILVRGGQVLDASVPLTDGTSVVGEKALYRLLTWKEGRFEFVPATVSEGGRIEKPSRALLMEGMRQLDEWEKLRRELPGEDVRLALAVATEAVPGIEQPLTASVVEAVQAYRRVGEAVDHCPAPDYQVLRVLQELLLSGALEAEPGPESAEAAGGDGLFSASQVRRMRDWAASQRPRPGSVLKLVVAAAAPEQTEAFHETLRECSDFMTDARLIREPERVQGLCTLGHFALGEGLSLRVVVVPTAPHYEPLWDVAAHGMLGALVLPRGPFGPALEETELAFARLRDARPQSVVHLIQADDPSGALTSDARNQLAHLEGGSVFVLPAEGNGDRLAVLRNVFARIVP